MSDTNKLQAFTRLHEENEPLLLGNVWDAKTAVLAEQAGFKALGSSSHAIAFTLGYPDGEAISFEELFFVVKRIVQAVKIPVSVDFESGYAEDPTVVAAYVKQLADIGVVGINLEDGQVQDGKRILGDSKLLVDKIKAIKKVTSIFINARADTYTTKHPQALAESIKRAHAYQEAGADGIFIPLIESKEDIKSFVEQVTLPLNVFTTPKLPAYADLATLGVKRISHGAKQYDLLMKKSEQLFQDFQQSKDYAIVLGS